MRHGSGKDSSASPEYDGVDDVSVDTPDALYEVYNLQGVRVGSGMREAEVTPTPCPTASTSSCRRRVARS